MFPFLPPRTATPPPRPTTPSHHALPPTAPLLASLYSTLLRPTLLPPPASFTQPLLDNLVQHHDPLLESEILFTAPGRLREVGVEVDKISREWGRQEELRTVEAAGTATALREVREARLRCRLQNQGVREGAAEDEVRRKGREQREKFEREVKREEEEALRGFKEGLRRAVGG